MQQFADDRRAGIRQRADDPKPEGHTFAAAPDEATDAMTHGGPDWSDGVMLPT